MPRANIYIQVHNEAKWKLINNKSAWVNSILADDKSNKKAPENNELKVIKPPKADIIDSAVVLCQHFSAKGFCKHSNCPFSQFKVNK